MANNTRNIWHDVKVDKPQIPQPVKMEADFRLLGGTFLGMVVLVCIVYGVFNHFNSNFFEKIDWMGFDHVKTTPSDLTKRQSRCGGFASVLAMCTAMIWTWFLTQTYLQTTAVNWSIIGDAVPLSFPVTVGLKFAGLNVDCATLCDRLTLTTTHMFHNQRGTLKGGTVTCNRTSGPECSVLWDSDDYTLTPQSVVSFEFAGPTYASAIAWNITTTSIEDSWPNNLQQTLAAPFDHRFQGLQATSVDIAMTRVMYVNNLTDVVSWGFNVRTCGTTLGDVTSSDVVTNDSLSFRASLLQEANAWHVSVTREVTWVDFLVALQSIVIGFVCINFMRAYQLIYSFAEKIAKTRSSTKNKYQLLTNDLDESNAIQSQK